MPKRKPDIEDALLNAQREDVEYLVFSGGGAKGTAYSGAYAALEQGGVMDGVKAIAGSSAGAISAALIATGMNAKEFESLIGKINLKGLLGKRKIISKDGNPLYQLLQENISANIASYLGSRDVDGICKIRSESLENQIRDISETSDVVQAMATKINQKINNINIRLNSVKNAEERNKLRDELKQQKAKYKSTLQEHKELTDKKQPLKEALEIVNSVLEKGTVLSELVYLKDRATNNEAICFKDLALLHAIDPITFKDLVITATRRRDGELTIFNSKTTPDVEIALAARASGSLPLVFIPAKIDGVEYVDGGYRDNLPIRHFGKESNDHGEDIVHDITNNPNKEKRTVAFAFGFNDEKSLVYSAIYSAKEKLYNPSRVLKFIQDVLLKMAAQVGGNFKYTETIKATNDEVRKNALNTIIVDTPGIGTISFDEAQKKAQYLHIKSYLQTTAHLYNHGLGTNVDPNYKYKGFLLDVYEKVAEPHKVSFLEKVGINSLPLMEKVRAIAKSLSDTSSDILLSYCKPQVWKHNEKPEQTLTEFIILAAADHKQSSLKNNTKIMNKLVETLNNPKTANIVKEDVAKLLKLENYDVDKTKFKKENFSKFLEDNQGKLQEIVSRKKLEIQKSAPSIQQVKSSLGAKRTT